VAVSEELLIFVRDALSRGLSRDRVEVVLMQAGWTSEQARNALSSFAPIDFPVPVPRPRPSLSARDAFLYLLQFTTLYVVAINLGRLLFEFINRAFPDASVPENLEAFRAAVRFAAASLIVSGPVFLYVSSLTNRVVAAEPGKRTSPIRRWLTYWTLFVAACVLLGDVTTLLYSLLGGELTTRFLLKVAVVGAIAGGVFWYYLMDLRLDERERR
jgi:hypothetical protein